MRQIKFRAYMPSEKAMCNWEFLLTEIGHYENVFEETDDWKPMQYTGLKDINGVEIYEGDIVNGFTGNGVVEWLDNLSWDGGGSIHPGFWCKKWLDYEDGDMSYHDGLDDCEVIGNIYENPELLTTKDTN